MNGDMYPFIIYIYVKIDIKMFIWCKNYRGSNNSIINVVKLYCVYNIIYILK